METFGVVLLVLGFFVANIGYYLVFVEAAEHDLGWGWGVWFFPIVGLLFMLKNPDMCKYGIITTAVGIVLMFVVLALAGYSYA